MSKSSNILELISKLIDPRGGAYVDLRVLTAQSAYQNGDMAATKSALLQFADLQAEKLALGSPKSIYLVPPTHRGAHRTYVTEAVELAIAIVAELNGGKTVSKTRSTKQAAAQKAMLTAVYTEALEAA